ncbi:hypothetical protein P389DRAFT_85901 [Cystobasidium minutum MCA 4210]|uniref:uncharacterized protein n=1 Tax=Cystobasidium minutum MCA 4210 TaxID=1397322 RepID=UPI0034CED4D2|eukprot:jgi/Rhomi1/85901/CE85900_1942
MADHNGSNGNAEGDGGTAAAAAQPTTLMSSFFPSPPSYFANFTQANLDLARKLIDHPSYSLDKVKSASAEDPKTWLTMQNDVLKELEISDDEIERLKDVNLASLVVPPEVDLVEADGHWMAFGQAWPIHEKLPTLEEMGVKQLYKTPTTWEERRQALQALLHTVLHTYLRLLSILTSGPPSLTAEQAAFQTGQQGQIIKTQADTAIEHIRLSAINIHHLCNEWRPVQARENLKMLMRNQIQERKRRTSEVRETCKEISQRLAHLKTYKPGQSAALDTELSQRAASIDIDDSALKRQAKVPEPLSAKDKATARMLRRLEELEQT